MTKVKSKRQLAGQSQIDKFNEYIRKKSEAIERKYQKQKKESETDYSSLQ